MKRNKEKAVTFEDMKINKDYKLKKTVKELRKIKAQEEFAKKINKNITKEDIQNTRPVWCDKTDKMIEDFQKFFDLQEQIDLKKYRDAGGTVLVKAHFESKDTGECMWTQVKDINIEQKFMYGRLGNSPIFIKNLKMGDWVTIKFKNIMAYHKGEHKKE
jgi:uncharacterized protein YegJ (DUF2314 family)